MKMFHICLNEPEQMLIKKKRNMQNIIQEIKIGSQMWFLRFCPTASASQGFMMLQGKTDNHKGNK